LLSLALGLGAASVAAAVSTLAENRFDHLPTGFDLEQAGVLGGLTTVSNETIVVALVAGVAGMLALETRASSGVGVAISVTTIPASAYLGVAVGLGELGKATGALGVLGVNVLMMVIGGVATLELQGVLARRRAEGRRKRATALRALHPIMGLVSPPRLCLFPFG
jgi:Domain of unknown function (DUF389)